MLFFLMASIAYRVTSMTLLEGSQYQRRARLNTIVDEPIAAPRGRFYDRKGRLLVTSQPVYDLLVVPAELRHPYTELRHLAQQVGKPDDAFLKAFAKRLKSAPLEDLVLIRHLDDRSLTRLVPLTESMRGAYVRARGERKYRYGKAASHVIGTMGAITSEELRDLRSKGYSGQDFLGKTGLDKQYEKYLRGAKGVQHRHVDASGRTLKVEPGRSPTPGNDLVLTLDMGLQLATEKAIDRTLDGLQYKNGVRSAGSAVVMKVDTGQVLAMASLPNFDPRPFARGVSGKEYGRLLADRLTPLVDRASGAAYSPGSTFKMITASAALQLGLCTPGSVFYCSGVYKGAHCFARGGHGYISFYNSLAQSCDVTYYRLGDHMGIRNLARFARMYGLGSATGIDLPSEDPGLIPDPDWKMKALEEPWYGGDTINSAIGQGFVLCTPLQMCTAVACLANGGKLYRPYLVDRAVNSVGRVVWKQKPKLRRVLKVDAKNLAAVRWGMRGAVAEGTGMVLADAPVKCAGKTGTVESFPSPLNPAGRNHTWFICFAPYDKPEIAIAVNFEASGDFGGSVAAPVARAIVEEYFGHKSKVKR
jgi:penicillin-binding protein 2